MLIAHLLINLSFAKANIYYFLFIILLLYLNILVIMIFKLLYKQFKVIIIIIQF